MKSNIILYVLVFLCYSGFAQNITSAEYFFNTDPGVGNGTALTVNSNTGQLTQTFAIPTSSLSNGFNSLYIRTQNSIGNWSLYERQTFYVNSFNTYTATAAEYFFNTDPGVGNANALSVDSNSGMLTQTYTIPTTGLSEGFHSFYLRTQNNQGNWSLYDRQIIYIKDFDLIPDEVSSAEYFIDSDPGVGNGTSIVFGDPAQSTQVLNINTTGLAEGEHLFYIRVQDSNGDWSIYDTALFNIDSTLSVEESLFKLVSIYPNPFINNIEISSSKSLSNKKVEIYDLTGKTVFNNNVDSYNLDLHFLPKGIYILNLEANQQKASFKIIKKQ